VSPCTDLAAEVKERLFEFFDSIPVVLRCFFFLFQDWKMGYDAEASVDERKNLTGEETTCLGALPGARAFRYPVRRAGLVDQNLG
jgi:hypothetical protein